MKKTTAIVLSLLSAVSAQHVQAQSISPAWKAYRDRQEHATSQQAATSVPAPAVELRETPVDTPVTAAPAYPSPLPVAQEYPPASAAAPWPGVREREERRGGFFIGIQGGTGWIYEDVEQSAVAVNGGYRWQAGPVTLVGVEVAGGRLGKTREEGYLFPEARFGSVGATARFNFGTHSRWYASTRLGYWSADADDVDGGNADVDGAYVGAGLGVDVGRNFNINLQYTAYLYASSYYYSSRYYSSYGTEVNRADMATLGVELRF